MNKRLAIGIGIAASVIPAVILAAMLASHSEVTPRERAERAERIAAMQGPERTAVAKRAATARIEDFERASDVVMAGTLLPGTLIGTPQARKLTKVQMTATVETERKRYTARRLTEQVWAAEEKGCLLRDCINYIRGLCAKVRSGYKSYALQAYESCTPGGRLYGYMGDLDGQRAQEGAVIRMTAVAYHPKPRPCEWKMMSLNEGVNNPRSPSECHDGSLHYSLEDMERGEDGRFDLPDHHPAHFHPAASPTPTP